MAGEEGSFEVGVGRQRGVEARPAPFEAGREKPVRLPAATAFLDRIQHAGWEVGGSSFASVSHQLQQRSICEGSRDGAPPPSRPALGCAAVARPSSCQRDRVARSPAASVLTSTRDSTPLPKLISPRCRSRARCDQKKLGCQRPTSASEPRRQRQVRPSPAWIPSCRPRQHRRAPALTCHLCRSLQTRI